MSAVNQTSPHQIMVTIMKAVLIVPGVPEDKLQVMGGRVRGHEGTTASNNYALIRDGRLTPGIHAHASFDNLELDLDFENSCKACPPLVIYFIFVYNNISLLLLSPYS